MLERFQFYFVCKEGGGGGSMKLYLLWLQVSLITETFNWLSDFSQTVFFWMATTFVAIFLLFVPFLCLLYLFGKKDQLWIVFKPGSINGFAWYRKQDLIKSWMSLN